LTLPRIIGQNYNSSEFHWESSTTKLQRILKLHTTHTQAMASSAAEQEQQQKNKQLVHQYFEVSNTHDTERMGQFVSSTNHSFHFLGMQPTDWNGHKQLFTAFTSAFPDLSSNIVAMVAEGDKVAVRFNVTGTHKGEFQGIPPTGKKVSFSGMDFLTIIDGKVVEEWESIDTMGLMQQIGAIPPDAHDSSNKARS
jgi:steroid delta-isomerase-like uncharacterized protein